MSVITSLNPLARRFACTPAAPAKNPAPAPLSSGGDTFRWSKALAPSAYTFGTVAPTLSLMNAYALRFPYGGVTLNPTGIIPNPDWTRHFADGTTLHTAVPLLSGFSSAIYLTRGALELKEASQSGDAHTRLAGYLDLGLAATSALQLVHPAIGGLASVGLFIARATLALHGD